MKELNSTIEMYSEIQRKDDLKGKYWLSEPIFNEHFPPPGRSIQYYGNDKTCTIKMRLHPLTKLLVKLRQLKCSNKLYC